MGVGPGAGEVGEVGEEARVTVGVKATQRIEYAFNCKLFMSDVRLKSGVQTLREIQDITGVSASTWSRIDRGAVPDIEVFMAVCGKLQMQPGNYFDQQIWELKK